MNFQLNGTLLDATIKARKYKNSLNFSAQNKGWKLVGHSIKIGTLLWTIIGFPIGNVQ